MRTCDSIHRCDSSELVRLWRLADGTRCVLASVPNGLELRIVHEGAIVRRAPCEDVRFARHSADIWRVDYEMEHAAGRGVGIAVCPDCGDQAIINGQFPDSARWLGCGSCGNVWLEETDAQIRNSR